ncbi:MAG TPA: methylenetetrahydrofolate reductase [Candidatus Acidoferrales bacterium]|nr:methylenetetrahydrofolate reductase [Candidatus Acidoferrales bacterium]
MLATAHRSAELSMPRGANLVLVQRALTHLNGAVNLVGLTDNHMGRARLSPLAAIPDCLRFGLRPVLHLSCRDRNQLGLHQQVAGASALGAAGVLVVQGDRRGGLAVDSAMKATEVIRLVPEWAAPNRVLRGAVVNPFADRQRELALLERKIAAGVDFIQTQMVFDLLLFEDFLREAGTILPPQLGIFVSVGILRAARNLDFVQRAIPNCPVPDSLAQRIREGQGVVVATELAAEIGRRPGLRLHVIPLGAEGQVRQVIEAFDGARAVASV